MIEIYCQFCGKEETTLLGMKIHLLKECDIFHLTKQTCTEPDCPYVYKEVTGSCRCNQMVYGRK